MGNLLISHKAAARSDIRNIVPGNFPVELTAEIISQLR
jgi:hypothetical protein